MVRVPAQGMPGPDEIAHSAASQRGREGRRKQWWKVCIRYFPIFLTVTLLYFLYCADHFLLYNALNREIFAGFLADCTWKGVLMAVSGQKNPKTGNYYSQAIKDKKIYSVLEIADEDYRKESVSPCKQAQDQLQET